jgi:hypothetical protein
VCGDGKLFVGWELCDQGPGTATSTAASAAQCEPGIRCGDHKLQPGFETCDLGPDNGGNKGDEQGILCDASCKALQLRGFVTAATFTGDLGGLFGADLKCRDAAAAAGLAEPERFHALLSTGDIDAKDRFKAVAAALPYVLVTGKKFADNFAALISLGRSARASQSPRPAPRSTRDTWRPTRSRAASASVRPALPGLDQRVIGYSTVTRLDSAGEF